MEFKQKNLLLVIFIMVMFYIPVSAQTDSVLVKDLFDMSLEDLLNIEITTASKYEQTIFEAPSSVTIITSNEIRDFGYNTLNEALNSQKGFYSSYDRNYSYIGNRGFGRPSEYNNRSRLLLNGHTLNENVYGSALLGSDLSLNLDIIDRIEIVRGPGSSMYGSGAMLNVINIITKKGADLDGLNIKTSLGSYNKKEISAYWGKTTGKGTDIVISGIAGNTTGPDLYFEELDSPETNNGISTGLDWEKLYGFYSEISAKNFTLKASLSNRAKGIPTGAWETDLVNISKSLDIRYFVDLQYKKDFNENFSIVFRSYYDGYKYDGTYSNGSYKLFDKSIGKWGGSELQFVYNNNHRNLFSGGIEFKYNTHASYKEWDADDVYSSINFPFSEFSTYVQDEYKVLPNLRMTAGLRFDYNSFGTNSLAPRFAAVYNIAKTSTFKLLYSEAHRTPNFYESKYESIDFQKINSSIKPERIQTREFVWEYQPKNNIYTSLSLYHYKMKELIDLTIDDNDGLTFFQNIGKVTGRGVEFEIKYNPKKETTLFLNSTLQKSVNTDTGDELTNSPRFLLKGGWAQSIAGMFTFSPECFYETKRTTIYKTSTNPFFLTNVSLTSKTIFKYIRVNLKIRNIFNQEYSYPGGFEHVQKTIIQDGRNFSIGVSVQM